MNKEIAKKWTKRLRSGKYEQGKSNLHKVVNGIDKFCCLGVLCEIAVEEGIIPPPILEDNLYYVYQGHSSALPKQVSEWAGISTASGISTAYGATKDNTLTELNDNGGYTFSQIADVIEKNVDTL